MGKKSLGQAYNRAQTRLYTWWDDGSVSYHTVYRRDGGTTLGNEVELDYHVHHNKADFWAFVHVAEAKNEKSE